MKQPPVGGSGDALAAEVVHCYSTLIRGLLDLTDNLNGSNVVPPDRVLCYDRPDSYLVVAADKGTAAFSDIANGIAAEYGFWLGDAFASGGSSGYDHKAMGITARGAWESINRSFGELGVNIRETDFTVIGIGDMSGDVFGNGMLLSRRVKLVAAFDHRHIFLDPDPDPGRSWQERSRLFGLPHSSWADYDRGVLSEGGGVFPRTAKSIQLTPQAAGALGTEVLYDPALQAIPADGRLSVTRDCEFVRSHGDVAATIGRSLVMADTDIGFANAHDAERSIARDEFGRQQIDLADELGDETCTWTFVNLTSGSNLLDTAVAHDSDLIGEHGFRLIMRHVNGRNPYLPGQLAQLALHGLAKLQVEGTQWLVHEQDTRGVRDRARECYPLLLPAADLDRIALSDRGQPDEVEQFFYTSVDISACVAPFLEAETDILADRHVRKQGIVLKDHSDAALLRRESRYIVRVNVQAP